MRHTLGLWACVFELRATWDAAAVAHAARNTARRAAAALTWWRGWRALQARKREWRAAVCTHMRAGTQTRALAAWRGRVARRLQLEQLEAAVRAASNHAAARTVLHSWWERVAVVATWRETTAEVAARRLHACMGAAFGAWRRRMEARMRDRETYSQIVRQDVLRLWGGAWERWCSALKARRKLRALAAVLCEGLVHRCVEHWKGRVDLKADWRAFEAHVAAQLRARRQVPLQAGWGQPFFLNASAISQRSYHSTHIALTSLAPHDQDCIGHYGLARRCCAPRRAAGAAGGLCDVQN